MRSMWPNGAVDENRGPFSFSTPCRVVMVTVASLIIHADPVVELAQRSVTERCKCAFLLG